MTEAILAFPDLGKRVPTATMHSFEEVVLKLMRESEEGWLAKDYFKITTCTVPTYSIPIPSIANT